MRSEFRTGGGLPGRSGRSRHSHTHGAHTGHNLARRTSGNVSGGVNQLADAMGRSLNATTGAENGFISQIPVQFFFALGLLVFVSGLLLAVRLLYFYFSSDASGHLQSVMLPSLLMTIGFLFFAMGILVDLISVDHLLGERLAVRFWLVEIPRSPLNQAGEDERRTEER